MEYLAHTLSASFKWGILHALAGPRVTQRGVSHPPSCSAPAPGSTGLQTEKRGAKDFQGPFLSWLQWVRLQESTKLTFKKNFLNLYMYFIYISQEYNSLPSASHIFQSFHLKSTGLESSHLMKAELLVDSHDSRRCCSLKSSEWWETLIISRELVTRAEDFE